MNRLKTISLIISVLLVGYACKKQDKMYREYAVEGGITYPGKAKDAKIRPGKEVVEISWLNIDPTVRKAIIYWNLYSDSVIVDISTGTATVRTLVNVPEGQYSFFIKTFDAEGNVSIPTELTCKVYGPEYENGLANRGISDASALGNTVTVKWESAFNDELGIKLFYTDISGEAITKFIESDEATVTTISDVNLSLPMTYQTLYLPAPDALDTIAVASAQIPVIMQLDKSKWKRYELPSDWIVPNSNEGLGHCVLEYAWDGISDITYDKIFACNATALPMTFTIDLGQTAIISKFKVFQWYTVEYLYHNMKVFELYGSNADTPGDDLSGGDWKLMGKFRCTSTDVTQGRAGNDYEVVATDDVPDPNFPVKYVRFRVFETFINNTNGVVVVPELMFYGQLID